MEDYRLYIELLRNLADEAGLPKTLDSDALEGIKSHEYCTNNQPNNFSDHVDPYPYLASWGISREQFKHDIENGLEIKKGWQNNDKGYWYVRSDGSYPKEQFEKIDGTWYYFDGSGYMLADKWKKRPDGTWYYFDKSGEMAISWKKIADKWYYFDKDGAMVKGWVKYKDVWYFLDYQQGAMVSNAFVKSSDGKGWYYLKSDGTLAEKLEFTVEPNGLITTK